METEQCYIRYDFLFLSFLGGGWVIIGIVVVVGVGG